MTDCNALFIVSVYFFIFIYVHTVRVVLIALYALGLSLFDDNYDDVMMLKIHYVV